MPDELHGLRGVEAIRDRCGVRLGASPRAAARRQRAHASVAALTGSIAGARSLRGKARPTACITASSGVRGAKVKSNAALGAQRQPRPSASTMSGAR